MSMTYQIRLPSELTDAEWNEAIDYWHRNLDLVSAEPILAMHLDEERRRLAVFLGLGSNAGIFDFDNRAPARPLREAAKSA